MGQNCNTHQCLRSSMNEYGYGKVSFDVDWGAWIHYYYGRQNVVRKLPDGNGYDFRIGIVFAHILHVEVCRNSSCFRRTYTHRNKYIRRAMWTDGYGALLLLLLLLWARAHQTKVITYYWAQENVSIVGKCWEDGIRSAHTWNFIAEFRPIYYIACNGNRLKIERLSK